MRLRGAYPHSGRAAAYHQEEDPVLEQVLSWTVERDARDVRRLMEWLPQARSNRERQALLDRVRDLLNELEQAMSALDELV